VQFIRNILAERKYSNPTGIGSALRLLIHAYGWDHLKPHVDYFVQKFVERESISNCVKLLTEIVPKESSSNNGSVSSDQLELCQILVYRTNSKILSSTPSSYDYYGNSFTVDTLGVYLCELFRMNMNANIEPIITQVLQQPTKYNLVSFVCPLLVKIAENIGSDNLSKLDASHPFQMALTFGITHLGSQIANSLKPPSDWNLNVRLSCTCNQCAPVQTFLNDPRAKEYSISANQSVRTHIERTIQHNTKDITCETIRRGSPHTLRLTKVWNSYKTKVANRQNEVILLQRLQSIQTGTNTVSSSAPSTSRTLAPPRKKQKTDDNTIIID